MKKIKLLSLGCAAVLSLGFTAQASSAHASVPVEPQAITQAADQIFVIKKLAFTTKSSIWVTEVRNGKTYSGYLYNRGTTDNNKTSTFSGYLQTGPYAPINQSPEK